MDKVLITGGAGFIGSHLTDYLLAAGHRVVVLDNLSTGSMENLSHWQGEDRLRVVVDDAANRPVIDDLVSQVDYVYHLAASVGVKNIMDNLVLSIKNNIDTTEVVLEAAAQAGKKVLLTSTSEVYGKKSDGPSRESDDLRMGETIRSRWSYACSKALDEYMAFAYYHERSLPVTVVRLFNTVGDRQTDAYGMVVPTFVKQALAGQPLTIHGDGQQSRCFAYVKDVVWALDRLMIDSKSSGEVFNIGSGEMVTINELADRVITLTGSKSRKEYIAYGAAYAVGFEDAFRREPDLQKIASWIGFEPKYNLDDIIKLVVSSIMPAPIVENYFSDSVIVKNN